MHDHNGVIQQNMVFFYLPFLRKTPLNRLYHLLIPVFVCHDHKGIRITAEYMKLTTQMEKILSQLRHEHIAVFCPKQHSHLLILADSDNNDRSFLIPHQFVLQLQLQCRLISDSCHGI